MKRIYIISLIIIIVVAIGSYFFITNSSSKKTENSDEVNIKDLKIISQHNEYIVALDQTSSETENYAVFKNTEYEMYKKVFSLEPDIIESRLIFWVNNKLYLFGYNPKVYNLNDGNIKYSIDLIKLLNDTPGNFDRVLGHDDSFIYYEYSHNGDSFFGKINFEFTDATIVEKKDIPNNLSN